MKTVISSGHLCQCAIEDFTTTTPDQVDYVAVSPVQIVSGDKFDSIFEHDDANRALMGSHGKRTSTGTRTPLVGTGLEAQAARDSGW